MEASGQFDFDLRPGEITAGQVLERIRRESRDEAEKSRWFENLVSRVLRDQREYEVVEVWRWADRTGANLRASGLRGQHESQSTAWSRPGLLNVSSRVW